MNQTEEILWQYNLLGLPVLKQIKKENRTITVILGIKISHKKHEELKYQLDEFAYVSKSAYVADNCKIGQYSTIGDDSKIYDRTEIGNFCSIAPNVIVLAGTHPQHFLSTHPFQYRSITNVEGINKVDFKDLNPSTIGNDVWIGSNVVIMGGIKIGDGSIIGAGSIVTKDVPPYAVVVGVPAKTLKYRFNEHQIKDLLELKWWNMDKKDLCDLPFDNIDECIKILKNRKN